MLDGGQRNFGSEARGGSFFLRGVRSRKKWRSPIDYQELFPPLYVPLV